MSHRLLGSVAVLALLTGVSVTTPASAETVAAPAPASAPASAPAAKPKLGDWGVDLTGMDTAVKPGDDFDAALMTQVIQYADDPYRMLTKIRYLIAPGAVAYRASSERSRSATSGMATNVGPARPRCNETTVHLGPPKVRSPSAPINNEYSVKTTEKSVRSR
jgi:hypothetical protein